MRNKSFITVLVSTAIVLSACGAAAPTPTVMPAATDTGMPAAPNSTAPSGTAAPLPTPPGAAILDIGQNTALGKFLTDGNGITLYLYTKDSPNTPTCYDSCAANWPPLLTDGFPTAGADVNLSLIGTTQRSDGSLQVTFNGWPLYFFAGDKAAGDTKGEGKASVWYVITPEGSQK